TSAISHQSTGPETWDGSVRPPTPRKLPLLGSNQDSPDPESGVLPITPRGIQRTRAGDGARTRDPQLGKLMLCQLSYSRKVISSDFVPAGACGVPAEEPPVGLEPTTPSLRVTCSTN